MKNLKKVLALVVALTMVLGTVAFAGYTDVAEDASEYTAVSTLSSLGILTGYEDGSFKPEGDITRAEFCAVVCRALGAKVSGSAVTAFSDVPADHWASAYIAYVAGQGIVNGMGDGTFAPDANVTFEQAVKMLVVALGYEPMAAQKGGYPTGYMVVANTYGITEGISAVQSAPASRGVVAGIVYNALDVPVMEQTGFGTQISYEILDGTSGKAYKTLLTNLDVVKLEGSVKNTSIIGTLTEKGYVDFAITEEYGSNIFDAVETFKVAEGVDAESYFGYAATVFVKEYSKNKYEIIAIMPGAESQVLELGGEDIADATASYIEYYTDDDKNDTKKVYLEVGSDGIIKNNAPSDIDSFYVGTDVEIKLIENNGNNKYDMIIAKEYIHTVVKSVDDIDYGMFTGIFGETFEFDFEDEDKNITLVDKNGDAIELKDFAEGDVIAYITDDSTDDYTSIEVINLGKNVVEGTIVEVDDPSDPTIAYVGDTKYDVIDLGDCTLSDEGIFYLTKTGKIFEAEVIEAVAKNYGYILGTAQTDDGWGKKVWEVKMLTKDNEIKTFPVKESFIDSNSVLSTLAVDDEVISDANANSDGQAFKLVGMDKRLVTYRLTNGEIKEIKPITITSKSFTNAEYNADAQKITGKPMLADDVVIFNIAGDEESSAFVTGLSSLIDESKYTGYASDDDGETVCLVITDDGDHIDYTQDLAIVTQVTGTRIDDEPAKRVRYYVSGEKELKEIIIMEEDSKALGCDIDDVKIGAIMMFEDDGNGVATRYGVLANTLILTATSAADSAAKPYDPKAFASTVDEADDIEIIEGFIAKATTKNGKTIIQCSDSADDTITLLASANTYSIKNDNDADGLSDIRVNTSRWNDYKIKAADKYTGDDAGKMNKFIAISVDGVVTNFIAFSAIIGD